MKGLKGALMFAQSGGPTSVINASAAGVFIEGLNNEMITAVYGAAHGIRGILQEEFYDISKEDIKELELLKNTPSSALGSVRYKLKDASVDDTDYKRLLEVFKKYNVRYFFYNGGNDSMDTCNKISKYMAKSGYEMNVIGVPKTIDNDLVGTDHTPGFPSAAKYIATTMAEIICDCAVYTTKAVTVVEIMGRDAGWLTASAGIGKAFSGEVADLIYLPERAFNKDEFFEDLRAILEKKPNVVVAVSEGVRFADGTYVCEGFGIASTDVFGHKQLSGTGKALEVAIKNEFGCKVRSIELNLPQRCASHLASRVDIEESVSVGRAAVKAASEGITRQMMTIERVSTSPYKSEISYKDVSEIANKVKHVPSEFINERGNSVTEGCAEYLLPLIQGELDIKYENGIPKHIKI